MCVRTSCCTGAAQAVAGPARSAYDRQPAAGGHGRHCWRVSAAAPVARRQNPEWLQGALKMDRERANCSTQPAAPRAHAANQIPLAVESAHQWPTASVSTCIAHSPPRPASDCRTRDGVVDRSNKTLVPLCAMQLKTRHRHQSLRILDQLFQRLAQRVASHQQQPTLSKMPQP